MDLNWITTPSTICLVPWLLSFASNCCYCEKGVIHKVESDSFTKVYHVKVTSAREKDDLWSQTRDNFAQNASRSLKIKQIPSKRSCWECRMPGIRKSSRALMVTDNAIFPRTVKLALMFCSNPGVRWSPCPYLTRCIKLSLQARFHNIMKYFRRKTAHRFGVPLVHYNIQTGLRCIPFWTIIVIVPPPPTNRCFQESAFWFIIQWLHNARYIDFKSTNKGFLKIPQYIPLFAYPVLSGGGESVKVKTKTSRSSAGIWTANTPKACCNGITHHSSAAVNLRGTQCFLRD